MNKFLTEYVFDEGRKDVIDFKTDIAIRGDIALCQYESKHKADELVALAKFLLNIPDKLFNYSVNIAKEYFDSADIDKLSEHISDEIPLIYLYTDKVLSDINEVMKYPIDTKKSVFCRYIEDLALYNVSLTKELLIATLNNSHCYYLHDIAQLYLTNINEELRCMLKKNENCCIDFFTVWDAIILRPICKSTTLTAEKSPVLENSTKFSVKVNTTPNDDSEDNIEVYDIQTEEDIDKLLEEIQNSLDVTNESLLELSNQLYDLYDEYD